MSYATQGYEQIALFGPDEILGLRADVTEHMDRVARALHLPFEASEPDAPFEARLERIAQTDQSHAALLLTAACTDAHRGPRFQALLARAELRDRAEALAGVALGEPIMRLRGNVPTLSRKRSGWHSDVSRLEGACSSVRIACWIPLMDAGPANGGLEVAVGLREAPLPHDENRDFHIDEAELEGLPMVQPDCRLGDVLFLDRFTPHRALPNRSQEARMSVVVWMKAAGGL